MIRAALARRAARRTVAQLRPPTVPAHLTVALDQSRRYEGWLNPPGRPCRCRFCTGTAPTRPPED